MNLQVQVLFRVRAQIPSYHQRELDLFLELHAQLRHRPRGQRQSMNPILLQYNLQSPELRLFRLIYHMLRIL